MYNISSFEKYKKMRKSNFLSSKTNINFFNYKQHSSSLIFAWPYKFTESGVRKSLIGPDITWAYTGNMYNINGISIGINPPFHDKITETSGPNFTPVVDWESGCTRVLRMEELPASSSIVGDVEVGGGLFINSSGLKFNNGTETLSYETSWILNEVVTAILFIHSDKTLYLGRLEEM